MADINSVKDASGYTIDDYKRMYNEARAANDAAGMEAANKAANAIRTSQNVAAEYATQDIANTANKSSSSSSSSGGSSYTTINQSLHDGTDTDKSQFRDTLLDTINYANQNPSVTQGFTQDEFNALYGNVQSPTAQGYTIGQMYDIGVAGKYTYDAAEAAYAAAQGYTVTQTTYNGNPAYKITPNENTSRPQYSNTSGADESLLNSQQYAAVQYEKQQWSNYDTLYRQALAAGNTALAEQYLAARDQAHTNAERIRASAWLGSYSGGADGSAYLTYGELANPEIYNRTDAAPYNGSNPYADAIGQTQSYQYAATTPSVTLPSSGTVTGSQSGTTGTTQQPSTNNPTATLPTFELPEIPDAVSLQDKITDYSEYIKEMQAAQLEANLAALDSAYQKNIAAIDRAGEGVDAQYQNARNQTAGASELAARNFAELAAANGLNTGTSGQAELARNVTLQNNMNLLNAEEAQVLSDLDLQRANVETDYNTAIAQAKAEGKYQEAQMLYQEKIRVESAILEAMQQEWSNAVTKYQLQYQSVRDQVSDSQWQAQFDFAYQQWLQEVEFTKQQLAMQQAQLNAELAQLSGASGGGASYGGSYDSGYYDSSYDYNSGVADSAGYTIDDYKAIYAQARESGNAELMQWANDGANAIRGALGIEGEYATTDIANVANRSSGVSSNVSNNVSNNTSNAKSTGSYSSGVSYNNGGLPSSQVKELQNYYGLTADGFWGPNSQATTGYSSAKQAWDAYQASNGGIDFFSPVIPSLATPEKSLAYLQDTVGSNGYGASFNTAWSQARKKFDSGASEQEIMNYLDTFSELRLTDAGLSYIMNSLNLGGYRG